jgi:integrase
VRKKGLRIYGPYKHGGRWRLVVRRGSRTNYEAYDSREIAEAVKARLEEAADGLTVADAVDRYIEHKERLGLRETTTDTSRYKLRRLLGLKTGGTGGPLRALTSQKAELLYKQMIGASAVDTHRNSLGDAKTFGAWLVSEGLAKANPFADVKATGRRRRGKPQLSIDESRRYLRVCLEHARAGDSSALAAALPLLLGPRASEVVLREVRDLDDGGRVLRVPAAKTANGKRSIVLPEVVRPLMAELALGKKPGDRLFPATRYWLYYHVKRLCRLAGVPEVSPHGLRGTHGSMAVSAGATSELVAATLGHSPTQVKAVTEGVYIAPGLVEQSLVEQAADRLLRN